MVSISDIAKVKRGDVTVEVRGVHLPVRGLSARQINTLLRRFPAIEKSLGGTTDEDVKVTVASVVSAVPEAMGIIAGMGTYSEGNEQEEAEFLELEAHEQMKILNKILELTFGDYWNPLLGKVKGWVNSKLGDEDAPAPGGRGMALDTDSLRRLRSSLRSATTPEMFGGTHPGNSPDTPS